MPTFDSGRGANIGGLNIRQKRGSDLGAIRFDADIGTTPTSTNDMLLYRSSNGLRFWDGSIEWNLSTLSSKQLTEVVTATNVLTAAESGKTCFLNSATEFATTLPAPAAGLHFKFVVTAAPSGADYTVVTESAASIIYGQATVDGAAVPAVAENSINFVSAAAAIGDWVEVWCDGTNWYVIGQGVAAGSITFTAV